MNPEWWRRTALLLIALVVLGILGSCLVTTNDAVQERRHPAVESTTVEPIPVGR